ncbi:MAG: archaellin/type IV pilin N-terminal domain-containing protein [Candidatus Nanoarchaeia archaeon]
MYKNFQRKGVTEIVAILLFVLITLSLGVSAFVFITRSQKTTQEVGTKASSEYLVKLASCLKIMSVKYTADDFLEVTIKNCGYREIDFDHERIELFLNAKGSSCITQINSSNCADCTGKLPPGSMKNIRINATNANCSDNPNNLSKQILANLGLTTELTISIKHAATSTTFIPERIIICKPPLVEPRRSTKNVAKSLPFSFNHSFNISNEGNMKESITLDIRTSFDHFLYESYDGGNCSGAIIGLPYTFELSPGSKEDFCVHINGSTDFNVAIPIVAEGNCGTGMGIIYLYVVIQ